MSSCLNTLTMSCVPKHNIQRLKSFIVQDMVFHLLEDTFANVRNLMTSPYC